LTEKIKFEINVDLKTKTWIRRGGIARIWTQPQNIFEFEKLICFCQLNHIVFEVVGNTSNCYFLNEYNPELVISTIKLNNMNIDGETIICDSGVNMIKLSKFCISRGYKGYEGFIGLPGTVGGAAINNSGCYGSVMSDLVLSIIFMKDGKKIQIENKDLNYQHRSSILKTKEVEGVVISVILTIISKDDPQILTERSLNFQKHRKTFQENSFQNLGSTYAKLKFKNLNFPLMYIYKIIQKLINLIVKDALRQLFLETKLFLLMRKTGSFKKYISKFGIGCFIWKDENADVAFCQYVDFIKRNCLEEQLEICIKGLKK
jgi:UDP-N-acetylmuramate dehydrogenase